ncbi:MAG: exopolysaccharide biosynthesis protein, partial [Dongiaceae bacterium]
MSAHPANHRKVSQIIVDLAREPKERVRLADLVGVLDERAFGVLMLILALPNAV